MNMRKHVRTCWGGPALAAANSAKEAADVRIKIVGGILRDGSITTAFERKGEGKQTFSHRQHTKAEIKAEIVHWVCEYLCPFSIVEDEGFICLMKTGQPEYYIPSPETVSRDVKVVFTRACQRIATMLQVSPYLSACILQSLVLTHCRDMMAILVSLRMHGHHPIIVHLLCCVFIFRRMGHHCQ